MTIDSKGQIFYDTGPSSSGIVAGLEPDGRVTRLVTGLPRPARRRSATRPAGASRLAPDGEGGVLVATGRQVIRIAVNNAVSVLAGGPGAAPGSNRQINAEGLGDGGPISAARFAGAWSLATDSTGNLYVADQIDGRLGTVRIRYANRSGEPVLFFPGTPEQVVVSPGTIQTIAGAAGTTARGDRGPARRAVLQGVPPAMAVVGERLYIASSWEPAGLSGEETSNVRLVNLGGAPITAHGVTVAAGAIDTVAGAGRAGHRGDGGPALKAAFSRIPAVAADSQGGLFIADELNNRVRKVDSVGVVVTVAGRQGSGRQNAGFNGNDRPATQALLSRPFDVEVGPGDRLYVSDRGNHQVRVVDPAGVMRAVPGRGVGLSWICADPVGNAKKPSPPESPQPGAPASVAADDRGNVYIANADARQVIKVDRSGVITTIVGGGRGGRRCSGTSSCSAVGDGGPAHQAALVKPSAVELTPDGNGLYVFDTVRIRFVNLGSRPVAVHGIKVRAGQIQTVVGDGNPGSGGDGGKAIQAQLGSLEEGNPARVALATDPQNGLLIADLANARVRRVASSGLISTFAGTGAQGASARCCIDPVALAVGTAGEVYVADLGRDELSSPHPRVWLVNNGPNSVSALGQRIGPGAVQAVAGSGSGALIPDEDAVPALEAYLLRVSGIALDATGQLYISGTGRHQEVDRNSQLVGGEGEVRKVDSDGTMTWLMGNGQSGFNGDGLKARLTSLNSPADLAFDSCGNLLVADQGNDRVRRLNLAACPAPRSEAAGSPERGDKQGLPILVLLVIFVVGAVVSFSLFGHYRGNWARPRDGD